MGAPRNSDKRHVGDDLRSPGGVIVRTELPLEAELDWIGAASRPAPIEIRIPGEPVAKGRARFGNGRTYTPAATENAEAWAKACILEQAGTPRLEGALSVQIDSIRSVPASWSKRRQRDALAGIIRPVSRPDFDNLAKLPCDAAKGLLWTDDAQIVDCHVRKFYGETPATILRVARCGA
jgi:Holliday junction resolvase RusA-like endonuclease